MELKKILFLLLILISFFCLGCKETVQYTIYFDTQGGSVIPSQVINENETATQPSNPIKEGYEFVGWYNGEELFDFSSNVTSNLTLTAKWDEVIITYTIKFEITDGIVINTQTVKKNEKITKPVDPNKEGYIFLGWFVGDVEYDFNNIVNKDIVLTAKWQKIEDQAKETYIISFNSNGGNKIESQLVVEGEKIIKPEDPIREGYVFVGWYYGGKEFDFNTIIQRDYSLIAKWEEEKEVYYTVSFNSNGGSKVSSQTVKKNEKIVKPEDPTRDGYKFEGWYFNGSQWDFHSVIIKNITLTARWSKVETYVVTFNSDGGSLVDSQTVNVNETISYPEEPIKDGCVFLGWYYNNQEWDYNTPITSNITLVARWGIIVPERHAVVFYTDTFVHYNTQFVEENEKVIRPADPEKEGCIFLGWYYNGQLFDFDTLITHEYTIIAQWEELVPSQCYITFDSDGGSNVGQKVVNRNEILIHIPDEPVKLGYTFAGWYLNDELFDFNNPITEDITLVAKWKENEVLATYTLSFDSNGGTYVAYQYVAENKNAVSPENPTREGYVFLGWYLNDQLFDFGAEITSNITLIAKWGEIVTDSLGFTYELNGDGTYTLTKYSGTESYVVIPSEYNGIPVTVIGKYSFYECSQLKKVDIPDTVVTIKSYAFWKCEKLVNIKFSKNLETLEYGFYECLSLKEVFLPASVKKIESFPFSGSYGLVCYCETPTEPEEWKNKLCYSGENQIAYWGVDGINVIKYDYNGVSYLLNKNDKTACITDSSVITELKTDSPILYEGDSYIINSIGKYAFCNNSSIKKVYISNNITSIGKSAFSGCANATIICEMYSKPSGFENGWMDTYNTKIFWGDYIENTIEYEEEGMKYLLNKDTLKASIIKYDGDAKELIIKASITFEDVEYVIDTIKGKAFSSLDELIAVEIPLNIKTVEDYAFQYCSNLIIYIQKDGYPQNWSSNSNYTNSKIFFGVDGENVIRYHENDCCYLLYKETNTASLIAYLGCEKNVNVESNIMFDDNNYSVVKIASKAFYNNSNIEIVELPNTLEIIESEVFKSCDNLLVVKIPDSVKSIGSNVFYDCRKLIYSTMPGEVMDLGDFIFGNCHKLKLYCEPETCPSNWSVSYNLGIHDSKVIWGEIKTDIYRDNGLIYILNLETNEANVMTYAGNDNFLKIPTQITVNEINYTVVAINEYAFDGCESIINIELPDTVTSVGQYAFRKCINLESVNNFDKVLNIGQYAFFMCTSLKELRLSNNLETIEQYTFYNCYNLIISSFPTNLTTIGKYAFNGCGCDKVTIIPDTITTVEGAAFSFYGDTTILCEAESLPSGWNSSWCVGPVLYWNYNENMIVYNDEDTTYLLYKDTQTATIALHWGNNKEVNIKSSIVFEDIEYIVTTIGNYAYYNRKELEKINLSNTIISVGSYAFYNSSSLNEVVISKSVQNIGDYAFRNCVSLDNIYIPNNITTIGKDIFQSINSLKVFCEFETVPDAWDSSWGKSSIRIILGIDENILLHNTDGVVYVIDKETKLASIVDYSGNANELIIKSNIIFEGEEYTVNQIEELAFYYSNIKNITLPDTITTIGNKAFYGCSKLVSIYISKEVTNIGKNVFTNCNSLSIFCEVPKHQETWQGNWVNTSSTWESSKCPVYWYSILQ